VSYLTRRDAHYHTPAKPLHNPVVRCDVWLSQHLSRRKSVIRSCAGDVPTDVLS